MAFFLSANARCRPYPRRLYVGFVMPSLVLVLNRGFTRLLRMKKFGLVYPGWCGRIFWIENHMYFSRIVAIARRAAFGTLLISTLSGAEDSLPFSPALPPPLGRLDISAEGADPVQVFVDGELVTATTPAIVPVSSGRHVVILRKGGFADLEQTLIVEPLETATLRAQMIRE
nr:MAG: PEGA domain-containing protein [Hyphomicrobiales bacterium]